MPRVQLEPVRKLLSVSSLNLEMPFMIGVKNVVDIKDPNCLSNLFNNLSWRCSMVIDLLKAGTKLLSKDAKYLIYQDHIQRIRRRYQLMAERNKGRVA